MESYSGHLRHVPNLYAWYHDPSSKGSPVILFKRLLYCTTYQSRIWEKIHPNTYRIWPKVNQVIFTLDTICMPIIIRIIAQGFSRYFSLWIDCLFEIRKIAVCFLWLSLPGDCRVNDEALLARNYVVWPTFFLMNVFIALKGSHFWILFDFTADGVVPCGGRKTSPRTSTIV